MHKCYICKEYKEAEDFNKDRSRRSGLMSKCRNCAREWNRLKRQTPEGKAKRVVLARKWKRANKIKENAHKAVARAIKSNILNKPSNCTKCDSTEHIQGHHPDYTKPLEVVWLCRECHLNHHKEAWSAAR